MKGKYLIHTDSWFTAPDGMQYQAVWGECETISAKEALGFEPNRNSANWFLRVGSESDHVLVAGCQIHFATKCETRPNTNDVHQNFGEGIKKSQTKIYIPEKRKEPSITTWQNQTKIYIPEKRKEPSITTWQNQTIGNSPFIEEYLRSSENKSIRYRLIDEGDHDRYNDLMEQIPLKNFGSRISYIKLSELGDDCSLSIIFNNRPAIIFPLTPF